MRPQRGLILVVVSSCILFVRSGFGDEVILAPLKDNTLYESSGGTLSNGSGDFFFVGQTNRNDERRGLLAFDIANEIPGGATIDSAVLKLNMSRTLVGTTAIGLHRLDQDWGEGASHATGREGRGIAPAPDDATWTHSISPGTMWPNPGAEGAFNAVSSATTDVAGIDMYTWGSTPQLVADVQDWLDNPAANAGWLLLGQGTAKQFGSRENTTEADRPSLTVNFSAPFDPVIPPGDANLDMQFNTADIISVLGAGTFEEDKPATWEQGDWNAAPDAAFTYSTGPPPGDGRFNTADIIAALGQGWFESGPLQPPAATAAATLSANVPEPSAILLLGLGILGLITCRRRS